MPLFPLFSANSSLIPLEYDIAWSVGLLILLCLAMAVTILKVVLVARISAGIHLPNPHQWALCYVFAPGGTLLWLWHVSKHLAAQPLVSASAQSWEYTH